MTTPMIAINPSQNTQSQPDHSGRVWRNLFIYIALCICFQSGAKAEYLINPAGGTWLFTDSTDHDDEVVSRSIGFTASFYGQSFSSITVSTNGNLNFSGTASYTNYGFPAATAMIAPLWDDLYIFAGSGESILETALAGQYYAVTWDVSQFSYAVPSFQFQTVIFGADTNISGYNFLQNDIVFAYQRIDANFRGNSATIGLNAGNGIQFATLPGLINGNITDSDAGLLPTGAGQFMLMRYDGTGYQTSIVNVPEPSSFVIFGLGLGAVAIYRNKK